MYKQVFSKYSASCSLLSDVIRHGMAGLELTFNKHEIVFMNIENFIITGLFIHIQLGVINPSVGGGL